MCARLVELGGLSLVMLAFVGCAATPAVPPASEYVWSTPRADDTRASHLYGVHSAPAAAYAAPAQPAGYVAATPAPLASVSSSAPWVESSDPRWSTHRVAAPLATYDASPAIVTVAAAPVYYASPGYGGWGPRYYSRPVFFSRPFVGVGVGVGFGGGFRGGFGGGFHGGGFHGGGFHGGGFRGGGLHGGSGSHGWGRR